MGRPRDREIVLSETERASLMECVRSRSAPHGLVRRARIVLGSASGRSNTEIARELGISVSSVCLWRSRFLAQGLVGLYGEQRPGRPRSHDDEAVAALLNRVLQSRPESGTHWTVRGAAAASGISKSSVQRYFQLFGIPPHRTRSFKLSTDPLFVEKVRDIVCLYLSPPDHAVVLCVDEKSKIQALERTQPMLPMGLGYADGLTHDYRRHGTTTLFAALDIANGRVITQCRACFRHQEFLGFLKQIDANVPPGLEVHLVVDNYGSHKAPEDSRGAGAPSSLPPTLHANLCVLAQSGRARVRDPDPTRNPSRFIRHNQAADCSDRNLRRQRGPPLPLGRHSR